MIQIRPIYLILLFFFFLANNVIGQLTTYEADYHDWFDGITRIENSELHQGIVYVERHRTKGKKTKFFPKPDFILGSIVFEGQPYFNLNLKYNVYDDELLMQVDRRLGGSILQLYKTKIEGFSIGGHDFIKVNDSKIKSGFYEITLKNSFGSLLKKHRKIIIEQFGKKLIFYDFEDGKKECFLYYKESYHPIKKVSDLTDLFPEQIEQLESFNKNQNSNADFDLQLEDLLGHLDSLLNTKSSKIIKN